MGGRKLDATAPTFSPSAGTPNQPQQQQQQRQQQQQQRQQQQQMRQQQQRGGGKSAGPGGAPKGGSGSAGGSSRRKPSAGSNANHLLNFQFQPLTGAHQGPDGGRSRRSNGAGAGRKGGGGWGTWSARGPMSKEQFLQANFHFLLHNPAWKVGDASLASPALQEAFFDPDVLVDWDTVDTVRLFRHVSKSKETMVSTVSPRQGGDNGHDDGRSRDKAETTAASSVSAAAAVAAVETAVGAAAAGVATPEARTGPKTVLLERKPAVEHIGWGSAKRLPAATAAAAAEKHPTVKSKTVDGSNREASSAAELNATAGKVEGRRNYDNGEEDEEDEEWRCSICLGPPRAPRVTKCGHGPFCLVCILRHLGGEASARCPLCFDKMHRTQLRRASCNKVVPFSPKSKASLVLLRRERTSLVPRASADGDLEGVNVGRGGKSDSPGAAVVAGGDGGEKWAAAACPREGDESEQFSRLVTAQPSTLRDLAAAEYRSLLTFRHDSIAEGETEWVPYISQAQALVRAQLDRFSALSALPPTTSSASPPAAAATGTGAAAAAAAAAAATDADTADATATAAGAATSGAAAGEAASPRIEGATEAAETGGVAVEGGGGGGGGGAFRFFQSTDGQKAFLHPLDMRQLLEDAEKGLPLPKRIDAKVLEVETVKLTPEIRRRLPFLGHLPMHCDITFLEVDMVGIVSEGTTSKFREETQKRHRKRRTKAAQEARAAAKEVRAETSRTARIAAMRAFTVDLQGPTPGGDPDPLPPPQSPGASAPEPAGASPTTLAETAGARAGAAGEEEGSSPANATAAAPPGETLSLSAGTPSTPGEGAAAAAGRGATVTGSGEGGGGGEGGGEGAGGWSFARVTAMNGHFPSLKPSTSGPAAPATSSSSGSGGGGSRGAGAGGGGSSSGSARSTGAWNSAAIGGGSGGAAGGAAGAGGAWGTKKSEASSLRRPAQQQSSSSQGGVMSTPASAAAAATAVAAGGRADGGPAGGAWGNASPPPPPPATEGVASTSSAGKKKGRKGKAVPLFSNAGVRGGR